MRYAWSITVALAACYSPSVNPGAPCGPDGECPSGLECNGSVCVPPGSGDAALPGDDAPRDSDVTPSDAAGDAPTVLGPWGSPVLLTTGVSSETDPSMTQNRLTLVFMSETTNDLYIATRGTPTGALTATALTALNSTATDKSPDISPDGATLYFVSNRSGVNYDVYRSTFTTAWAPPTLVAELTSSDDDSDIAISPDGLTAVVLHNAAANHFVIHSRATTAQPFGTGVAHAELEVTTDIAAPTITNGGNVIYFHGGATRDIYTATRKLDGSYTTPVLVSELNTAGRDAAPFVLQDNQHLIFERDSDLYEMSR